MSDVQKEAPVTQVTQVTNQVVPEYGPWTSQIPKDVLSEDFAGYKTLGDFAKHYKELKGEHSKTSEKMKEAIFPPGKNATPAEIAAYKKALGIPEKAEEYQIDAKGAPENAANAIKEFALRNNMTRAQTAALFEWQLKMKQASDEARLAQNKEREKAAENFLLNEYKDKYKEKLTHAHRLVEKIGGAALKEELNSTGMGNSTELIKFVIKVSEAFSEDGLPVGTGGGKGEEGISLNEVYKKSMSHLPDRR